MCACIHKERERERERHTDFVTLQPENLKLAQQYFQLVGGSGSECGELGPSYIFTICL